MPVTAASAEEEMTRRALPRTAEELSWGRGSGQGTTDPSRDLGGQGQAGELNHLFESRQATSRTQPRYRVASSAVACHRYTACAGGPGRFAPLFYS
jgi:hypothetical protein